jgi:hypothetical protein
MNNPDVHFSNRQDTWMGWILFGAIVIAFMGIIGLWLVALYHSVDIIRQELLIQHYVAIVGLPTAAMAAFMLIFLFRQTSGPIELEGLGFKFKGAAGPIVLWMLAFLAMALALKVTW